jgi:predicted transcriptional regulator
MGIKLFDSEWKVMDVLWRRGTDTPAREVARELEGLVGWNKNTTYTVLKKCVEKGAVERREPNFLCRALVPREEVQRQAAEEKQVVFLDLYSEFVDENNELPAEASRDGVHLGKEYCQQWLAYLKTHTADFDTLYPNGPPPVEETPQTITADGSEQG